MSLSSELREPDSLANQFLDSRLPNRHDLLDEWRTQLGQSELQPDRLSPGTANYAGSTLELLVSLDLGSKAEDFPVLEYLPPDACRSLLRAAGYHPYAPEDVNDSPESADPIVAGWSKGHVQSWEQDLQRKTLATGLAAAAMQSALHASPRDSVRQRREVFDIVYTPDVMQLTHDEHETALNGVQTLWQRYEAAGRQQFGAFPFSVVVAPEIAPGFAKADLVVDNKLVEIKAQTDPIAQLPRAFDQALAYALLDKLDVFRLKEIAVYCGWQATLLSAELDTVISAGSRFQSTTLEDLRVQFHGMLGKQLDDGLRYYLRKQYGLI